MSILPYGRQWIDEDDIETVIATLKSDFLTTGPLVEEFESSLKAATGAAHAVVLNSGTSALHAAYAAAGLGPGKELVTSPLTFAATANAALYLGASVRFADVEPDTGNLDPKLLTEALPEEAGAIVPVDYAGHPAEYDVIAALARERGLPVIADAAHSLGATYRGRRVGTLADLTATSFHPVKPVTTAEGGAVFTERADFAERVRRFQSHGMHRSPDPEEPWRSDMIELGYNYRLTDVQCALGLSQLKKLHRFIARRREIARKYLQAFQEVPGLQLPVERDHVESGWHLFVVRVPEARYRRSFFHRLRELGIGVQVHYIPVYWHPYYARLGYQRGLCPNAEDFYARAVSLPIFPKMTDGDVDLVIEQVSQAAREIWG